MNSRRRRDIIPSFETIQEAEKYALTPQLFETRRGDSRSVAERDTDEKEDIDELVDKLKGMSVHDHTYAQTYSIAIHRMPSLKNSFQPPSTSIDRLMPSQSRTAVNNTSHHAERKSTYQSPDILLLLWQAWLLHIDMRRSCRRPLR